MKTAGVSSTGAPVGSIPLPDHNPACALLLVVTTGGIGARSGVDAARSR